MEWRLSILVLKLCFFNGIRSESSSRENPYARMTIIRNAVKSLQFGTVANVVSKFNWGRVECYENKKNCTRMTVLDGYTDRITWINNFALYTNRRSCCPQTGYVMSCNERVINRVRICNGLGFCIQIRNELEKTSVRWHVSHTWIQGNGTIFVGARFLNVSFEDCCLKHSTLLVAKDVDAPTRCIDLLLYVKHLCVR